MQFYINEKWQAYSNEQRFINSKIFLDVLDGKVERSQTHETKSLVVDPQF